MPAIPMILQVILAALFTPAILKNFGINLTPTDVQNGVSGVAAVQAVPPTTPGATPAPATKPTAAQTMNDLAKNPVSTFGFAAMGGVAIFLVAQLRAAAHEAGTATVDTYREAKKVTGTMANADGTTKNISRRAKN